MRHMRIWRYVDEVAKAGSLRQAAERLNVTASALQRRIHDVEEDLGTPLFERLPTGMRLTAAGEAFIRWVRSQASDLERVQSQIEDLTGMRRGLVRVACSQALAAFLLPQEIAAFTADHPLVHFAVSVSDHKSAVAMLRAYDADLALVFQPDRYPEFEPLMAIGQRLMAIMAADHPLALRQTLRLSECADYPMVRCALISELRRTPLNFCATMSPAPARSPCRSNWVHRRGCWAPALPRARSTTGSRCMAPLFWASYGEEACPSPLPGSRIG